MSVTIFSKDVSPGVEVQDKFIGENYRWTLEEGNENYIKEEMGI